MDALRNLLPQGSPQVAFDFASSALLNEKCGAIRFSSIGTSLRHHCRVEDFCRVIIQDAQAQEHPSIRLARSIAKSSLPGAAHLNALACYRQAVSSEGEITHDKWVVFRPLREAYLPPDELGSVRHAKDFVVNAHDISPEHVLEALAEASVDRILSFVFPASGFYFDSPPPHTAQYTAKETKLLKKCWNWRSLAVDAAALFKKGSEATVRPQSVDHSLLAALNISVEMSQSGQVLQNFYVLATTLRCLSQAPLENERSILDRLYVQLFLWINTVQLTEHLSKAQRRVRESVEQPQQH